GGPGDRVGDRVSRRQASPWAQEDPSSYAQQQYAQDQYAQPAPAPPPAATPLGADMFEQLRQLAELKDQGIPHGGGVRGTEGKHPRYRRRRLWSQAKVRSTT